jgi:hypothetical protein
MINYAMNATMNVIDSCWRIVRVVVCRVWARVRRTGQEKDYGVDVNWSGMGSVGGMVRPIVCRVVVSGICPCVGGGRVWIGIAL